LIVAEPIPGRFKPLSALPVLPVEYLPCFAQSCSDLGDAAGAA
jgi:hypothetical protein